MQRVSFSTGAVDRTRVAWRSAAEQPNWIVKVTALAFLLVVVLPILLLLAVAGLVAAVVFAVLIGFHRLRLALSGLRPRDDGRENVRVIRRDGESPVP
jgi:hypothetical protein